MARLLFSFVDHYDSNPTYAITHCPSFIFELRLYIAFSDEQSPMQLTTVRPSLSIPAIEVDDAGYELDDVMSVDLDLTMKNTRASTGSGSGSGSGGDTRKQFDLEQLA